MQPYLDFLHHIINEGVHKDDRTGVGTVSVFSYEMRFNLQQGFPLLTTKNVHFKSIAYELLWFLQGNTNVKYLQANGVKIWDEWADEAGNLGPVYGKQWRSWLGQNGKTYDQIFQVIEQIKNNPSSRRLIVSAWNVAELEQMALAPCHSFFQFYVCDGVLSCKLTQRSADAFLGVPFNIASYSLLTHMVAQQCGLQVGEFIWSGGDCHIYDNHREQVELQFSRVPGELPQIEFTRVPPSIFEFEYSDFKIVNYHPQGVIKAPVAV